MVFLKGHTDLALFFFFHFKSSKLEYNVTYHVWKFKFIRPGGSNVWIKRIFILSFWMKYDFCREVKLDAIQEKQTCSILHAHVLNILCSEEAIRKGWSAWCFASIDVNVSIYLNEVQYKQTVWTVLIVVSICHIMAIRPSLPPYISNIVLYLTVNY